MKGEVNTQQIDKNLREIKCWNFKLFVYQERERQRKKIIFAEEYNYNILWLLVMNKLWLSVK